MIMLAALKITFRVREEPVHDLGTGLIVDGGLTSHII